VKKSNPSNGSSLIIVLGLVVITSLTVVLAYLYFFLADDSPIVQKTVTSNGPQMKEVLVASNAIESGAALEVSMFRLESVPVGQLAPNYISHFDQIRGGYAASYIAARQPLSLDFITMKAPVNQIQATIPEGYRAVSLSVDAITNVEGWARTGAKVDVLLASSLNSKPAITVIVQNAKVLSSGRGTGTESATMSAGSSTVTLMVTTEEAAKLQLASSSGALSLALRGDDDPVETSGVNTVTIDAVLGVLPAQTAAPVPSEGKVTVDGKKFLIINGKLVPDSALTDK
jgi:pilus assembly protein CpaB